MQYNYMHELFKNEDYYQVLYQAKHDEAYYFTINRKDEENWSTLSINWESYISDREKNYNKSEFSELTNDLRHKLIDGIMSNWILEK